MSKYRASVTAEAEVREGVELHLRHHAHLPGMDVVMEAGARTEKQSLWPDDHTADALVDGDEAATRWRCCAVLRALVSGSRNAPHVGVQHNW